MRKNNGITLIALVVTIIVLLILAGVSITTLTGDNGILTSASNAKIKSILATAVEEANLEINAQEMKYYSGESDAFSIVPDDTSYNGFSELVYESIVNKCKYSAGDLIQPGTSENEDKTNKLYLYYHPDNSYYALLTKNDDGSLTWSYSDNL